MSIALTRIDERLIHGQVAYSWTVAYQIDCIVVVDNEAANDETQKMLLEMAVPSGKSHEIFTVSQAAEYFKTDKGLKTFIVVKSPATVLDLLKNGVNLKEINVGGIYFKKDRKEISKTVFLNNEEIDIFKQIIDLGTKCEIRTSPQDKSIDLSTKI